MLLKKITKFLALVFGLAYVLTATSDAEAQFTLTIDTVADTWAFTGTDTGTGDPTVGPPGTSFVLFEGLNPNLDFSFDQGFGSSFSIAGLPGGISGANLGYRPSFAGSDAFAEFFFTISSTAPQTITADGTEFSYAFVSAADQVGLEALIGTTLNLQQGTGFSPISVVAATAVPEPNSTILLLAALCPLALKRKRNPRSC